MDDVGRRLESFEAALSERLDRIEGLLQCGRSSLNFFDAALAAFEREAIEKRRLLSSPVATRTAEIMADGTLSFSHRRILECLLRRFDYARGEFNELHATALCREARVGKGHLAAYLRHLLDRGYIEERDDGYRRHLRAKASAKSL